MSLPKHKQDLLDKIMLDLCERESENEDAYNLVHDEIRESIELTLDWYEMSPTPMQDKKLFEAYKIIQALDLMVVAYRTGKKPQNAVIDYLIKSREKNGFEFENLTQLKGGESPTNKAHR